ncbi:RDD family protein [Flavobacterium ponti]|uniref:RDD family protein n=1 Tax=Flavobacterium ponti TaxID=665133 RepID=A0ABV9P675_9FLAO
MYTTSQSQKVRITNDMLASKGKRLANFVIDYFIRIVLVFGFGIVVAIYAHSVGDEDILYAMENMNTITEYLIGFLFLFIYYLIFESINGRTIGKYITNTKVLMIDGSKASSDKVLMRTLSRIVPFEFLSFLGNDDKGWHDTWTDTVVVDIKKYEEIKNSRNSISEIGVEI